ncbi:MAG: hypothetical protein V1717_03795 [Candidatus Micrarchaeota archaeon]
MAADLNESLFGMFEAVQNAVLISVINVFDFIFGLQWAEGDSVVWIAIAFFAFLALFA